ncbi:MAG: protein BatD [Prolixibacteraceae bacterium]|nr:protein BatD [Prolixibacteraceae bacterium]
MNRKIFILLLLFLGIRTYAEDVRFTMSAPEIVSVGEQFSLTLTLNAKGDNLQMPQLDGFDILMGPSVSTSRSFSSINGTMTQSVSNSYTYILRGQKEGTFSISPASIRAEGKNIQSNQLSIKVIQGRQPAGASAGAGTRSQGQDSSTESSRTSAGSRDDLFIQYEVDKKNVYKGEMISVAFKLYSRVNLSVADQTLPSFEGFWTQDIDIPPADQNRSREAVDGIIYNVYTLQKKILIPQQTGTLYIEPAEMVFNVQQRVAPTSIFDDFFGSVQNIRTSVRSNRIAITVKDLPPAPADFKGAVGKFTLSSEIDNTDIKSNEAITIKVKISGSGNLKHINAPSFKFPADFEIYDPKTSYDFKATESGITGSTVFEQVIIPRYQGNFTIPAQNFVYFDVDSKSYKTLSTQEFNIRVAKGSDDQSTTVVSSMSKEDVKYIGKDIRYIKTGNTKLQNSHSFIFGSFMFYFGYIAALLAFAAVVVILQKKARENANLALMRNRKASKMARKHLKAANECLKANNKDDFYEALLKAFWGYLSDKLTIPQSELTRDNVRSTLISNSVESVVIDEFIKLIDICEMARYAPTAVNESISELYSRGEKLINNFEKQILKKS